MKKSNILKIFMTLLLAFMVSGLSAQILTDYSETQLTEATSYQTAGKDFRLYVEPDPIYSPSYDPATNGSINADAEWTWNLGGLAAVAPWVDNATAISQNYVEIDNPASGNYTVSVAEGNTVTGCVDATPISLTVEVIDAPTAVIGGTTANGNYSWTGASPYTDCEPAITGTETITVTITEDADLPEALRSYALLINETVVNLLPDLATQDGADLSNTDWDYTVSDKLRTGNAAIPGTHTWTPNGVGTATSTYSFATSTLEVQNSKPTRYTYTIAQASDAPGAGIVSAISHKSDYLGGAVVEHAFGATTTISYIVLPAPVTGPIYHIPNNFNYVGN